jgi:glycine oxidase
VTLLERGEVGGQASGAAAGMLIPPAIYNLREYAQVAGKRGEALPSGPLRDLCLAGLGLYPSLVDALQNETGIDVQYIASGILLPAQTEGWAGALRDLGRGQRESGPSLEWVEGEPLRRLEPALSDSVLGAAYSPREHHLNPGLLTQALARAAVSRGAVLRQGAAVSRFLVSDSRLTAVRTSDGDIIAADHIVLAAGPWTRRLGRGLGFDVPTRPLRGQMLAYRSRAVRHIIWGDEGYLVPKAGGFLYAGATVEDVGFRPRTTRRGLAGLRRMAAAMAPALRYAEVASVWAGLRPGSPDGHPIIGRLPGKDNVYVATGHFRNGILLGPITGRLIAQLITEGKTETSLAPFSAARFG